MNEYKTIDQLISENGNLAIAVGVLIRGCINKDSKAISEWDKIRRIESNKSKVLVEK